MRMLMSLAAAWLMTAGGAVAASQFDLDCSGSKAVASAGAAPSEAPWQQHLRVDLQVGEYCQDDCGKLHLMLAALPNIIVFENAEDDQAKDFTAVSRETGEYYSTHLSKASLEGWTIKGVCNPAPFSGIPILTR